jgi:V/A-type H+-transporting ATPase subunit A
MAGVLTRISGCTAAARGLGPVGLHEVVRVGRDRLAGEVVRIERDVAVLQIYEDGTGVELGEPVERTGEPLSVELGPGLLGSVYDGLQRPLHAVAAKDGDFVSRGAEAPALDRARRWTFEPCVAPGDVVRGGQRIGTARSGDEDEPVLAAPGARGRVAEVRRGEVTVVDPVVLLEGGAALAPSHRWPVRRARPFARRLPGLMPLLTGQRVLDVFFPVALGSASIVPGGFGTGKTVLEQSLARFAAVDVVVYVGCGERGNEMADVLAELPALPDPRTGRPLLGRTVLVANTSNMPVAAREASIYVGMAIAEYFRDTGRRAALLVDSTSRWAEALREISARLEEMPGEEGYPTSLATRTAAFYERAGRVEPLGGGEGSVTAIGAVSPPGGDFSEPVTQASLRATSALWALSADLAHRRHFPAIDWNRSWSSDAARLGPWFAGEAGSDWPSLRAEALALLDREREIAEIAELVGIDALQDAERATLESARLLREGFLRQNAWHPLDASCSPRRAAAMLRAVLGFHRQAGEAVARGVPWRAIAASAAGDRLLRLGEVAEDGISAVAGEVGAALDAAGTEPKASPRASPQASNAR